MEMSRAPWFRRRSVQVVVGLLGLALVLFTFPAAAPFQPGHEHVQRGLDPRIVKIMAGFPYRYGHWGLRVVDPATGRVVQALGPAQRIFVQGSVTKLFSVSAALDDLGFDHRITTPVYALGRKNGGTLSGNLVLVAQGDLTMGGAPRLTVAWPSPISTMATRLPTCRG
jgi:D-alanyl-D-alanine carboxypeptidase/D-alanyl-D-alanine-endopeptidase (penicillin-binding protein 4)